MNTTITYIIPGSTAPKSPNGVPGTAEANRTTTQSLLQPEHAAVPGTPHPQLHAPRSRGTHVQQPKHATREFMQLVCRI